MNEHLSRFSAFGVYALFVLSTISIAASGVITLLLYGLVLARFFVSKQHSWNTPLTGPILALIGSVLISSVFGSFAWSSLAEVREVWRYFLPFVIWQSFKKIRSDWLLSLFLIMLIFISVYGVIQYYSGVDWFRSAEASKATPYAPDGIQTGVFHAKGNFSHHLTYAHYLLLVFPIYVSLALCPTVSWQYRLLMALGSGAMLAGLFFSLGRSAWLGALAALGILTLQLPRKWWMALLILGAVAGPFLLFSLNLGSSFTTYQQAIEEPIKARIDSIATLRHHRDRLFLWESAWMAIEDNFWFGIGLNKDAQVMPPYRQIVATKRQHTFINRASAGVHNIYLQTWLNFGMVGLLCYLWFWGTLLFWTIRWLRQAKDQFPFEKALLWGMLASFVGYLLASFFENSFRDGEIETLLFALLGWTLHLGTKIQQKRISGVI